MATVLEWDEAGERRLRTVERKIDRILDPETGLYPRLTLLEQRFLKWAVALLTTGIVIIALELVQLATRGHG